MASRIIVRMELAPSAKKALESLTEKEGMTQLSMLSRLVEWLANQPEAVRAAILHQDPSDADAARLIIKHVASGGSGCPF